MSDAKTYQVQFEITRTSTVGIAARDASKARETVNNLECKEEVVGAIVHWVFKDAVDTKR